MDAYERETVTPHTDEILDSGTSETMGPPAK
jgi:hypothetical protein